MVTYEKEVDVDVVEEMNRYKQALSDIAQFSSYVGARLAASNALDLDVDLRKGICK